MASSSNAKANLLGKRTSEDGLETEPVPKKHKDLSEDKETTKEQIEGRVDTNFISVKEASCDLETKPILNRHREISEEETTKEQIEGRVDTNFISVKETSCDLETQPILKRHREISEDKETTKGFADDLQQIKARVELFVTKSDEANLISVDETLEEATETEEGLDETPKEPAVPKKTLFFGRFHPQTEISDIIDFFKDVGKVVRLRLQVTLKDSYMGQGFVEFASANEAKKALEKKKGEYLHDRKIFLDVANKGDRCLPPKYCLDHKVWYEEDYLQQESLQQESLQQESLTIEEDETPSNFFAEAVATIRNRTLFVANLSPQTTKILHIIRFFEDVAKVVSVRLIVNHEGKHVGYGFVEFASPKEAKKALDTKNGEYLHDHRILLMKGLDETPNFAPDFAEAVATVRNKTLFVARLPGLTKISDIINFFKDVGEVVHVRLIVDPKTRNVSFGFVEFASANEAEKALEKKNGEYLHNHEIILDIVRAAQYPIRSRHCIDHKVWYDDYPQPESLLTEEDAAVEGLDDTEEVKTVFVANLSMTLCSIKKINNIFKDVGEVVRVRLIVDHWGEHQGCCFVEFASANEAKKAVQEKNGTAIYVKLAETAPYPFRPKYNLADLAEQLWYEDCLRRKGFGLREDCLRRKGFFGLPNKPKLKKKQLAIFCGKKITFSDIV